MLFQSFFSFFLLLNSCAYPQASREVLHATHPNQSTMSDSTSAPSHTNALIQESSPYLLQHAHNPVDWRPWSEEAWQEARATDKLVIVSIGYSACHWCHVMEHETFEDSAAAAFMNEHFISINYSYSPV